MYIKTTNRTELTNLHYVGDLRAGQPFRYPQDEENTLYLPIDMPAGTKTPENYVYCINLNTVEIELISTRDTVIAVEILRAEIEFYDIAEGEE